jgi:hypothetical protein
MCYKKFHTTKWMKLWQLMFTSCLPCLVLLVSWYSETRTEKSEALKTPTTRERGSKKPTKVWEGPVGKTGGEPGVSLKKGQFKK